MRRILRPILALIFVAAATLTWYPAGSTGLAGVNDVPIGGGAPTS